jgi:hypothetical protein
MLMTTTDAMIELIMWILMVSSVVFACPTKFSTRFTQANYFIPVLIILNKVLADPDAGLVAGVVELKAFEHFVWNLSLGLFEGDNEQRSTADFPQYVQPLLLSVYFVIIYFEQGHEFVHRGPF